MIGYFGLVIPDRAVKVRSGKYNQNDKMIMFPPIHCELFTNFQPKCAFLARSSIGIFLEIPTRVRYEPLLCGQTLPL